MSLPQGLLPAFVFTLTVGVSTLVVVVAWLSERLTGASVPTTLRTAVGVVSVGYLVGVAVVWWVAGGGSLWGVVAGLVAAGLATLVVVVALPLAVGQWLLEHASDADAETALRHTTAGWPVAMALVFCVFVAPGTGGHLFDLGGPTVCLLGFCGVSLPLLVVVGLELAVTLLGPGVVGLMIHTLWSPGGATPPVR